MVPSFLRLILGAQNHYFWPVRVTLHRYDFCPMGKVLCRHVFFPSFLPNLFMPNSHPSDETPQSHNSYQLRRAWPHHFELLHMQHGAPFHISFSSQMPMIVTVIDQRERDATPPSLALLSSRPWTAMVSPVELPNLQMMGWALSVALLGWHYPKRSFYHLVLISRKLEQGP